MRQSKKKTRKLGALKIEPGLIAPGGREVYGDERFEVYGSAQVDTISVEYSLLSLINFFRWIGKYHSFSAGFK